MLVSIRYWCFFVGRMLAVAVGAAIGVLISIRYWCFFAGRMLAVAVGTAIGGHLVAHRSGFDGLSRSLALGGLSSPAGMAAGGLATHSSAALPQRSSRNDEPQTSISTMLRQLACLGVKWNSRRLRIRRASAGSNAW